MFLYPIELGRKVLETAEIQWTQQMKYQRDDEFGIRY